MPRTFTVSDSVVINASPQQLYDQISDVTQMGKWSPENRGATLQAGSGDVAVGMSFDGRNKRGSKTWVTRCTVTAADPGERFAFRVHSIGFRTPRVPGAIATWQYQFEAVDEGTRVTETWTDDRRSWPDFVANAFDKAVTGGKTFAEFQVGNIRKTLSNLKAAIER